MVWARVWPGHMHTHAHTHTRARAQLWHELNGTFLFGSAISLQKTREDDFALVHKSLKAMSQNNPAAMRESEVDTRWPNKEADHSSTPVTTGSLVHSPLLAATHLTKKFTKEDVKDNLLNLVDPTSSTPPFPPDFPHFLTTFPCT